MNLKNKNSHKSGFTLIETTIAIVILIVVITGPLALAAQSLKAASHAKNNFIAANLAQEGLELIRLYRTNNIIQGQTWLDGLISGPPGNCQAGPGCRIDAKNFNGTVSNFEVNNCQGGNYPNGCLLLKIDANGFYNYTTGNDSIFQRTIRLTSVVADKIVRVRVTITWQERTGNQTFVAEEIMHNWLQL